jgi:hypothetical protein
VAFGLLPRPELVGKRYVSLNWIDANQANQYRVGKDDDTPPKDEDGDQHNGGADNEE